MAHNKSFIRWAGGKSWLVPFVAELIEGIEYENYFEPFMGGASIFFSLDIQHRKMLSDTNKELVNAFCSVRDNPKRVITLLNEYKTDETSYYAIRESKPIGKHQKAARFLYLNANSFNGLYRVNRQGKYNVPYGHTNRIISKERLLDVSEILRNTEIIAQDFAAIEPLIGPGDLVFLDPPYTVSKETNANGFIAYNATLFSLEDQRRLGRLIDHIIEVGAFYILTNAAHESILEIFEDKGRVIELTRNSHIGGKNSYRGKVSEYMFTNIPERGAENE